MNIYIKMQIRNIISMVETFEQSCQFAAKQDDGTISKEEQKTINKINKISEAFLKELRKLEME